VSIVGTALVVTLSLIASPMLAAASALFTVLLVMATFARGKALVVIRAGEMAIAERDETLSLLLRENEREGEADWLWEIDAQQQAQ
ncbi:hypothetical protein, partial [Enterobacter hormaechei]|uniref:hypothetical protein n=1 Tax=Enterobacter hormaechei TaxID=158836 RepID=UPI001954A428